jgi:hypothetical protein
MLEVGEMSNCCKRRAFLEENDLGSRMKNLRAMAPEVGP